MSRDPDRDRMFALVWPLVRALLFFGTLALLFFGCATPGNRLVRYPEASVLFTTPADVDRLCKLAPTARHDGRYLGCYFPAHRLAIVPHGDVATLAHELRHAREGSFHP